MGFQETRGFCTNCNKYVLVRGATPNHILHLLLTLVTCGLWLIVWVLLSIAPVVWRCSQCGAIVHKSKTENVTGGSHKLISEKILKYVPKNEKNATLKLVMRVMLSLSLLGLVVLTIAFLMVYLFG